MTTNYKKFKPGRAELAAKVARLTGVKKINVKEGYLSREAWSELVDIIEYSQFKIKELTDALEAASGSFKSSKSESI